MTTTFNPQAPPATMGEVIQGLKSMSVEEAMFALNVVVILVKNAKVNEEMTKLEGQNTKLKAINDALAALAKLKKELGSASGTSTVKDKLNANLGLEEEVNRNLRAAGFSTIFPGSGQVADSVNVYKASEMPATLPPGRRSLNYFEVNGQMMVAVRINRDTFPGGISLSTKVSDLEAGIQKLQGESSLLGQTQQMTMVDLQSLISELNAATEMGSSILRKWADLVSGTLQKAG